MPPWADQLDGGQLDDVTDFVMTLPARGPGTPAATTDKYLQAPAGAPEAGRVTYVQFCSSCHGAEGRGDGPFAKSLQAKYKVLPRNLTQAAYFENKSDQDLFSVISLGGGHYGRSTMMPAWTVTLKPDQIKDLVAYIRAISGTRSQP
jgi:mono/diheme cytochrome c family protein